MATTKKYTYAVGRRKSSSARVRLFKGKGESTVNGKKVFDYFPGKVNATALNKPLETLGLLDKYHFTTKVVGGGKIGQLEAIIHGISRALNLENKEKNRKLLKKAGLLTRDSRVRLRRMVGMGGKSRRKRQSPKR